MDNDLFIIIIAIIVSLFVLFLAVLLLAWASKWVATLLYAYSEFVIQLPPIIIIPAFIIFPPAFSAFLAGLVYHYFGEIDDDYVWRSHSKILKRRYPDKEKRKRKELGYDDSE